MADAVIAVRNERMSREWIKQKKNWEMEPGMFDTKSLEKMIDEDWREDVKTCGFVYPISINDDKVMTWMMMKLRVSYGTQPMVS